MKTARSTEYGPHQLLNPEFRYVPSLKSDIRATFERARARIEEERRRNEAEAAEKVRVLKP